MQQPRHVQTHSSILPSSLWACFSLFLLLVFLFLRLSANDRNVPLPSAGACHIGNDNVVTVWSRRRRASLCLRHSLRWHGEESLNNVHEIVFKPAALLLNRQNPQWGSQLYNHNHRAARDRHCRHNIPLPRSKLPPQRKTP